MSERSPQSGVDDATRVLRAADIIGRENELAALTEVLANHRMCTLHGPPGAGKSRLARASARTRGRHVVCDVSGCKDASTVERALVTTLDGEPPPQEPEGALSQRLDLMLLGQDERTVVIDHVDHVDGVQDLLDRLAQLTTAVSFVVTSRALLDVVAAGSMRVDGLGPDAARTLFIDRAYAARADFDAHDTASIDRVISLVDGLPLAIELAAARVRVMSPADLAERVSQRLDVLKSRTSGPRHGSLHAAFDESWELLEPDARRVLAASSVFEGSFDLRAAEHVLQPLIQSEVIDVLEHLIDASLMQSTFVGSGLQFELLRTVREYGKSRLGELVPTTDLVRAHDEWMLEHTCRQASAIPGPNGVAAFRSLDGQREQLFALLERLAGQGDGASVAELLLALRWHVLFRGPVERYQGALERVLSEQQVAPTVRAKLGATLAEALVLRGDRVRAAEIVAAIESLVTRQDQPQAWLEVKRVAAMVEATRGAAVLCETLERLAEISVAIKDQFLHARILERLGLAHTQANDIDRAWLAFKDAQVAYANVGDELFVSSCATGLGYVELRLGRTDTAIQRFRDALALHDASANHFLSSAAHFNLGVALHGAGEVDEAAQQIDAALNAWHAGGFTRYRVPGLVRLGLVQAEQLEHESAWATFAEAIRLGRECQDHHNAAIAYVERAAVDLGRGRPVDFDELERMVPGISAGADPDAFGSALVLLTALAARAGRPPLPYVNRLEELAAVFADDEPHIRDVVGSLRDVARSWHCLWTAQRARDENERRQHVARAWEWGSTLVEDESTAPNPFARLWAQRLHDFGTEFAQFGPLQEAFRAVLTLHSDGEWYQVDGRAVVDLATRKPLRLLMQTLAELARTSPSQGLDVDALAAAGWPGEELGLSTRRNRVYTAIRFLREMDLEDILITSDAGYRFADDVGIRLTTEPAP